MTLPCRAGLVALAAVALGCGGRSPSTSAAPVAAGSSKLAGLLDRVVAESRKAAAAPIDLGVGVVRQRADSARRWIAQLDAIDARALTPDDRVNRDLLRWEATKLVQDTLLYWYRFDALPALSPLRTTATRLAAASLGGADGRTAYLTALADGGRALAGVEGKMTLQLGRGIVLPLEEVDRVIANLRLYLTPARENPLTAAAAGVPDPVRATFERQVADTLMLVLTPAATSLIRYLDGPVRRAAPAAVGMWQYPGGRDAYRVQVLRETTLETSPEAIHALALAAMDTLEARMAAVRDSLGFRGTKADFHERLRQDRRFYATTTADVGARLMSYADRIEPLLDQVFSQRPKAPYGVRRVDPALEASMTYGYYNWPIGADPKGYYNFNGSDLDQRSLLMAPAIAWHELVPGHHFNISLQRESAALSPFRRAVMNAGFTEGWAEYASSVVASELGVYRDGYEIYGRLVFDAFFVARLVVDTGMNFYAWPRSRAVAYMREHTLESEGQIDSETLRYSIRQPAQALAYRMGRESIVGLRRKAERTLGAKFDVRRWHDAVLRNGAVPLFLLEREMDRWLAAESR